MNEFIARKKIEEIIEEANTSISTIDENASTFITVLSPKHNMRYARHYSACNCASLIGDWLLVAEDIKHQIMKAFYSSGKAEARIKK